VIDLNADLGEGAETDEDLLQHITSANVACGAHAGDLETIRRTVALAQARGVGIGAHPSFPDREGFGRRAMTLPPHDVMATVAAQIEVVARVAGDAGVRMQHVKPHGALYNQAAADHALGTAIGEAVRRVDAALIVVALAGSPLVTVLLDLGLRVAQEAFIDRGYSAGGTLMPRSQPGALITDPATAAERAVRLATQHVVSTESGETITVKADTLCIHGDTPRAAALAKAVRHALSQAGVGVSRLDTFV
jgi:UPF0271 protein